jgi:hypothetical protein
VLSFPLHTSFSTSWKLVCKVNQRNWLLKLVAQIGWQNWLAKLAVKTGWQNGLAKRAVDNCTIIREEQIHR